MNKYQTDGFVLRSLVVPLNVVSSNVNRTENLNWSTPINGDEPSLYTDKMYAYKENIESSHGQCTIDMIFINNLLNHDRIKWSYKNLYKINLSSFVYKY